MNKKLQEERQKALDLLNYAKSQQTRSFNLSDFKSDKTLTFESPYQSKKNQSSAKSPFEPSEISARSTLAKTNHPNKTFNDHDFDEIMRSSASEAVRNKYRESIGVARLSSLPRTADVSMRSSTSSTSDFWGNVKVAGNSFNGTAYSVNSEDFVSAEKYAEKINEDEIERQKEFAVFPPREKGDNIEGNWDASMRQPEMSFGQYANNFLGSNNIRDLYNNASPKKRNNRVALVEINKTETPKEPQNRLGTSHLQKLIKNCNTPQAQQMLLNLGKNINGMQDNIASEEGVKNNSCIFGISSLLDSLDFDKVVELAVKDREHRASSHLKETAAGGISQKENKDKTMSESARYLLHPQDALRRDDNSYQGRGLKRRSSSVSSDTPKTTLDKCMRSKSPTHHKELKAAAASMLKPKIADINGFKVPDVSRRSNDITNSSRLDIFTHKSPQQTRLKKNAWNSGFNSHRQLSEAEGPQSPNWSKQNSSVSARSSSSREYVTAHSVLTPGEKYSLPNYGLVRSENVFTSPTSSYRSEHHISPNLSQEGQLKRTVSQLSNGSEFHDDVLPIKIKRSNRKLSWETTKLYQASSKTISIQNGSNKKLHLRVKIEGAGFSVTPREEFRMIPLEARTFEIRFSPSISGPVMGTLIFELASNSKCMKTIPIFAYGGHAAIRIEGVQKGPIGPAFVTMGQMKNLNMMMEQQLKLTNHGTVPGFASLVFEKTKWSDFSMSDSLRLDPPQVRLAPGESTNINIRFQASKEEIRKIVKLNKEITIVGEICLICGDEPTRLRLLNNKEHVPSQFIKYLPKRLHNDLDIKRELVLFNEDLDRVKLLKIMEQIKTHEVALTISRNLDESHILADLSLADDTTMSFETFCETNVNRTTGVVHEESFFDTGYLESKYFRVSPAQVIFSRRIDKPEMPKIITIESTSNSPHFAEAVSSKHDLITATKSCGSIYPGESVEIKVCPKMKAFTNFNLEPMFVSILIENAKVDVPVLFV